MNKFKNQKIPLFWYSLYNFNPRPKINSTLYMRELIGLRKENYGDLLSKFLFENLTGEKTRWYNPIIEKNSINYFGIGSILNMTNSKSVVWGSGILNYNDKVANCDFRAVRGPLSRKRINELGFECPEVYGDPALLLSVFFKPEVKKKYELGLIPHFYDYNKVQQLYGNNPNFKIVNFLTNNILKTTKEILMCDKIITSSLHGLIIAHSYGIPAVYVKFSNHLKGDGVKFEDYLLSVQLRSYKGENIKDGFSQKNLLELIEDKDNLPKEDELKRMKTTLLKNFPLKMKMPNKIGI